MTKVTDIVHLAPNLKIEYYGEVSDLGTRKHYVINQVDYYNKEFKGINPLINDITDLLISKGYRDFDEIAMEYAMKHIKENY